jgi:hypothetical protein
MKRLRIVAALAAVAALLGIGLFQSGDVSASSLTSSVLVRVRADLTAAVGLASETKAPVTLERLLVMENGTGASQANVVWTDQRTIAASSSETLDFKGSLTNALGEAFTPAKIRAIIISAASANTNNVVVGGDAATAIPLLSCSGAGCATATSTFAIQPNGLWLHTFPAAAGLAVTASTGDILTVANSGSGTSVTYSIIVIGTAS